MSDEWYEIKRVIVQPIKPGEFRIATAAVRSCDLCGKVIFGMGGPGNGVLCVSCGDALRSGKLRGTVKRE